MSHQSSFLPEDYLAQKQERRTNFVCLLLFAIVMSSVVGAFLVTNQQWAQVKSDQRVINTRYQEAGKQIHELAELERQRDEMLHKAEIAAALVERVPRSILLAELINRMPSQLGLLEFELRSTRLQAPRTTDRDSGRPERLSGRGRAATREEKGEETDRVDVPRYRVTLGLTGVAPTDIEVSRFLMELNSYRLLRDVTLVYSEEREIEGRKVRQFRINMLLAPDADVRQIDPLQIPRMRNPMRDEMMIGDSPMDGTVSVPQDQ